ncbi:Protein-lysine methyltransferase METTL21D [Bienertia sinuspersici]
MKFTDSPVITLEVANTTLSLEQDNASMHVGTSVWPCSLVLVKFADHWSPTNPTTPSPNPYSTLLDFRHKRAIELGTGCGVAGMGLYLLGLHNIILTDIAPVMPALKHNLKKNKPVLNKSLKTAQLYWANSAQMSALSPPFDVVVAADVVYIEESVRPLVETMVGMLKDDGVVLLGYQLRSPEADKLFWEVCNEVFEIQKIPHQHLHPQYCFEETDVYVFRKKNIVAL